MESMIIQMLVILAAVVSIDTQCLGGGYCTCHCWLGCGVCATCDTGWSGSKTNYCQRQNVAYYAVANPTSSSTVSNFYAWKAVDEDFRTYALTNREKNPQLKITLANIFNIKHIILKGYAYSTSTFQVFVTHSASTVLYDNNMCIEISVDAEKGFEDRFTCNKTLPGNMIVVQKVSTLDSIELLVYEVKVYQCSQGTYGDQCEFECRNCLDNRCDQYTGICENGCNIGRHETCLDNKCQLISESCSKGCSSILYGAMCNETCPPQCESSCDRYLGCIDCAAGYFGSNCYKCLRNTYGKNCSLTCQNCKNCDPVRGCIECTTGFYGADCKETCPEGCRDRKCDKKFGNCLNGCIDGYMGDNCKTPCRANCTTCFTEDYCTSCLVGTFGTYCEYSCPKTCGGNKSCFKIGGQCSECFFGMFGPNCTEHCSQNCKNPTVCQRDGKCFTGCVEGWYGPLCNRNCSIENCAQCILKSSVVSCELCNIGYYIDNKDGKCIKCPFNCITCENESKCTRCESNFSGEKCNNECNKNCVDGLCEINGTCTYGCSNSKYGVGCSEDCSLNCMHCYSKYKCEKCVPGFFGSTCRWTCPVKCFNCTSYNNCDACKPGFYGSRCNDDCHPQCLTCDSGDSCTSCRDGWSGRLCQCSENCENENCDDHGICQSGCNGSYYGERCDVPCPSKDCQRCDQISGNCTVCSKGLYGINCTEKCSGSCLGSACDMTGACLQGCEDGFAGNLCTEREHQSCGIRYRRQNIF